MLTCAVHLQKSNRLLNKTANKKKFEKNMHKVENAKVVKYGIDMIELNE